MSEENHLRESICRFGYLLHLRGYAHGSSGNISALTGDGILITPTNSCLGLLDPGRISKLTLDGHLLSGDQPSKEAFLHLAMYANRPVARSIVHLHCTHAVAVSCRRHPDPSNVLPAFTAYHVMKVGRLPLVPYHMPGDAALANAVRDMARTHSAVLLANHGPVVAGKTLEDAVFRIEELEETARLSLLLENKAVSLLTAAQIQDLQDAFPS